MLKELSFENTRVILKYLIVVIIVWAGFSLLVAQLNRTDPRSNGAGVIKGDVGDVTPTQVLDDQPVGLATSSRDLSEYKSANSEIQRAFQTANEAIRQGDSESAMSVLVRLIAQHPELPGPYANLASLQAANGQLAKARATLLQGLHANKGYAALFSNLQKVQGAMAANAYTTALADQGEAIKIVALPLLEHIGLSEVSQQLDGLNQELQAVENRRIEEAVIELNPAEQKPKANN